MTDYDPFGTCHATNSVTNERCTLDARHEGQHVGERATWGGENRLPKDPRPCHALSGRNEGHPCVLTAGHKGHHITRDGTWPQLTCRRVGCALAQGHDGEHSAVPGADAGPLTQESVNDAMMVLERRVWERVGSGERSLATVKRDLNKSVEAVAAGEREALLRLGKRVTDLGDGLGEIERRMTVLESRMAKLVQDLKPVTEPAPPRMEYPHRVRGVTVIGPECLTVDGSSIVYRGVRYVPASLTGQTTAETLSRGLERLKREIRLAPPACGHMSPSGSWTCIRPELHDGWHADADEGAPVRHTWPWPCGSVSPSGKECRLEVGHADHHSNLGADGMDQVHWTNDGRAIHPDLCMDGSGDPWCRQKDGHHGDCDPEPEMSSEEISAIEEAIVEFGTGR
jgi:hypothetical protein